MAKTFRKQLSLEPFMKQFYLFVLVLFAGIAFPQQQPLYMSAEVDEMPVFPGCEHIKASRKKKMNECLAGRVTELLNEKMGRIDETMTQYGISKASAVIQFIITKEGVMLNFSELKGSNPILSQSTITALDEISMEILPIIPAKLKKGEKVNLLYHMPITYESDEEEMMKETYEFPVDEIVLFTMKNNDAKYEVRLFQNQFIKIYEINERGETYLGRFLSMGEVERSEPYKSMIENERKAERILVSAGSLSDEYYEIYIYNLFQQDKKNHPIYVKVEKLEEGKRIPVQTFEKEIDFNRSIYAPLIYRE